ncbi:hypothetical protein A9R05_43690 (plasmid) [Burkholderia sp. KK1]|nr:hypothetical protein A9R05_43690 [Burkholderia sp. KK1]
MRISPPFTSVATSGGEGTGGHERAGILDDIDEAARASQASAKSADIDIPSPIDLGHAKACEIRAAAVIEIEPLVPVQERLCIDARTEVQSALRHPADHSRLGGQREMIEHPFFRSNTRDRLGHPDSQVDHARRMPRRLPTTRPCARRNSITARDAISLDDVERSRL